MDIRTPGGVRLTTIRVRAARDFGIAAAEARLAAGRTQADVAASAGIDRTYLSRLEAGATVQHLTRVLRVLRVLGAEVTVTIPDHRTSHAPNP